MRDALCHREQSQLPRPTYVVQAIEASDAGNIAVALGNAKHSSVGRIGAVSSRSVVRARGDEGEIVGTIAGVVMERESRI